MRVSVISCLEAKTTKLPCKNVGFAVRPDDPTVGSIFQLIRKEEALGRGPNNRVGEHQSPSPHQPAWLQTQLARPSNIDAQPSRIQHFLPQPCFLKPCLSLLYPSFCYLESFFFFALSSIPSSSHALDLVGA